MPADPKRIRALRKKAEKLLAEAPEKLAHVPGRDLQGLIHGLSVYQLELEMQNEELRKSQEQLEQSRSEYAELYDLAPVGYLTFDNMGLITRANLTAAGLLGIERSFLVKKPFAFFVRHESQDLFHFHTQQVSGTTTTQTCQLVLKRKDGTFFDAQIESIAVQVDGKPAVNSIVTDITERKQAEETLRRYELLSHNSRDIVLLVRTEDGSITEANAAAERTYGYSRDELLKLAIHDLRVPGTRGLTAVQMAQADAGGILFETIHQRKDGSAFPVEVSSQGATIDGTRMLISVVRDIARRRQVEEALQRSEQRYRSLFENMLGGFAYCKMLFDDEMRPVDFVYLEVNDAFGRLTGLRNVMGRKVTEVIPGIKEAHPELFETYGRVALTGSPEMFEIEFAPLRAWLAIAVYSTERGHFVAVFDDISERKRSEAVLNEANRRLIDAKSEVDRIVEERTSELTRAYESLRIETEGLTRAEARLRQAHKMEAVGTLAGGIAHDFNNILAAIIGFSEMAQEKSPEGSQARSHMERVFAAGIRGRELVKQILTFSRQTEQAKLPIKLAPVVRETLKLLRASLPSTIDIRQNLQRETGFVLADPIQMQQIVMNLCTNGAHAMRLKGGSLSIDLTPFSFSSPGDAPDPLMSPGSYARLSVTDTGEGISRDIIEHIFDPFFTTKAGGEGTGLGLSVVHGIVTSHGGTITVSSEQGSGSTFTVYLPKLLEGGEPRNSGDGGTSIPRGHERILFVDDEKDITAVADEMLTDLGYRVTAKTGAREALALFRLGPYAFDVVITDQTMPEITGEELVKEILAIRADMPVIMCTGFSYLIDADKAKAAGIKAFAMKPLTRKEIANTIRKALDE